MGGIASVFTAIAILAAANYQVSTALALVQAGGLSTVLLAFTVVALPFMVLIACVLLFRLYLDFRAARRPTSLVGIALATAVVIAFFVSSFSIAVLLGSLLIVEFAYAEFRRWRNPHWQPMRWPTPVKYGMPILVNVLALAVLGWSWAPDEQIELIDGTTLIGSVMGQDDGWTTVLRDEDRLVVYIPASGIASRAICNSTPRSYDTAASRLFGGPENTYPGCDPTDGGEP